MRNAPLGEFEQIVLLAILRLGVEAYGVSIAQEILTCTHRKVAPGALYTTLARLEAKSALASKEGSPTPQRGGRAKRFYTVTPLGKSMVAQAQRAFQRLTHGLGLLEETHG